MKLNPRLYIQVLEPKVTWLPGGKEEEEEMGHP